MKISKLLIVGVLLLGLCSSQVQAQTCTNRLTTGIGPNFSVFYPGQTIEYTVEVSLPSTAGTCTLTNVKVYFFPAPSGIVGGGCSDPTSGILLDTIATLSPGDAYSYNSGDNAALAYVVQESDEGTDVHADMCATFTLGTTTGLCDEKTSINSAIPIPEPDILITKEVDCDVATVGATVTYTYCVYNTGPLEIVVTALDDDVVPDDLLAAFYAANGNSYLLAPDDEAEGGDDEVCFTVQYTIQETDDDPLLNTVEVYGEDTQFAQAVYDDDDATVDIVDVDFTVTKVCLTDPVPEGEDAAFEITITNTGDVDLVIDTDETEIGTDVSLVVGQQIQVTVYRPVLDGDVYNEINVCAELPAESEICVDPELLPICKSDNDTCGVQGLCYGDETAWALGNIENWDVTPQGKNWGWTNGPLDEGHYEWPLYAGAGQNDISKGMLVGTVTVDYSDDCATVAYEVDEGYYLGEAHLWVGATPLPMVTKGKKTVATDAPGQFPYKANYGFDPDDSDTWETEWSIEVCGLEGNIYVAAHSVVWMEVECPPEICDNGIDDDQDGLIDTADPDCQPQ